MIQILSDPVWHSWYKLKYPCNNFHDMLIRTKLFIILFFYLFSAVPTSMDCSSSVVLKQFNFSFNPLIWRNLNRLVSRVLHSNELTTIILTCNSCFPCLHLWYISTKMHPHKSKQRISISSSIWLWVWRFSFRVISFNIGPCLPSQAWLFQSWNFWTNIWISLFCFKIDF